MNNVTLEAKSSQIALSVLDYRLMLCLRHSMERLSCSVVCVPGRPRCMVEVNAQRCNCVGK
jgi:hypothetical protein